ncbi:hypothetical protein SFR_4346 [Streptomyces sp. FR-008]|nr:hypothetical protein SFR_4346 [Streptomyces sp. FR-008]
MLLEAGGGDLSFPAPLKQLDQVARRAQSDLVTSEHDGEKQ